MNRGAKSALFMSCVALAGCATTQEVKVRAVDPSRALKGGNDQLGLARAQLLLGNVGLALEGFRSAQRAMPTDPAPAAGIGDCYAAMGRYDLAETSYEVALSLAPRDHNLLLGLASILDHAGDARRAADIRAEAARFQQIAHLAAVQVAAPATAPAVVAKPAAADFVGSITVDLPPPRPAEALSAALAVTVPNIPLGEHLSVTATIPPVPAVPHTPKPAEPHAPVVAVISESPSPRLERLNSGEIALVTTAVPVWQPPSAKPLRVEETKVRWTELPKPAPDAPPPLRMAAVPSERWVALSGSSGRSTVQVLNAARSNGVAASARNILSGRGWSRVAIGNAPVFRRTSVVYYPKSRAKLARNLAAQFGVRAHMIQTDKVVLVLGRDLADRIASQRRS